MQGDYKETILLNNQYRIKLCNMKRVLSVEYILKFRFLDWLDCFLLLKSLKILLVFAAINMVINKAIISNYFKLQKLFQKSGSNQDISIFKKSTHWQHRFHVE